MRRTYSQVSGYLLQANSLHDELEEVVNIPVVDNSGATTKRFELTSSLKSRKCLVVFIKLSAINFLNKCLGEHGVKYRYSSAETAANHYMHITLTSLEGNFLANVLSERDDKEWGGRLGSLNSKFMSERPRVASISSSFSNDTL